MYWFVSQSSLRHINFFWLLWDTQIMCWRSPWLHNKKRTNGLKNIKEKEETLLQTWMFEKSAKVVLAVINVAMAISLSYCFFFFFSSFFLSSTDISQTGSWLLSTSAVNWQFHRRMKSPSNLETKRSGLSNSAPCVFAQIYWRAADTKLVWPDLILITERTGISSSGIRQLHLTWGKWYLQKKFSAFVLTCLQQ